MSEMPGSITTYNPGMAHQVAAMFNAFNELWPGGFTGGIPYDEQRVRDFLDKTSAVADLLALDENGEPVGYCGLYPHWRDPEAAFITVLGVVPRVKGHKFGRRLLLHAFKIAEEKGFRRVDLGTWAGNTNAVPLYKKTGLFWVPETNVYMQNFLPGLAQVSLAQAWFTAHPDWYSCFQRDLEQAPDDETVDGMAVYTYHFQSDEDSLSAVIDRYGMGVCGIESSLGGQRIAVKTHLKSHNIHIGIENALTITIENGTPFSQPVVLSVEAFKGQHWQESFPSFIEVPGGEKVSLERAFLVDQTAQTYHAQEPSQIIRTRLILTDKVIELITGGKIQPAVELKSQAGYQVVQAGSPNEVNLDLINNTGHRLAGNLHIVVEGLSENRQYLPFELEPNEVSGAALTIDLPEAGPTSLNPALTLRAEAIVQSGQDTQAMAVFQYPLVVDQPELAVAVLEPDGRHLHLLTDQIDVRVELEGGSINAGSRTLPGIRRPMNFEPGPPYGMGPDSTLQYSYTTRHSETGLELVLTAESRQQPGLRIQKQVGVAPGRKEVAQRVILTNLNTRNAINTGGRMGTGGFGGISLNPYGAAARSYTPLDGKIIECDAQLPFMNDTMLPQTAEHWTDSWTAVQSMARGDLAAFIWKPDGVTKIKVRGGMLSSLEREAAHLQPGESLTVFYLWYGTGYNSVEEVRHRWNQLVGNQPRALHELASRLHPIQPAAVHWVEDCIFMRGERTMKEVWFDFVTAYPLTGQLSMELPEGWQAGFETESGDCLDSIPMPAVIPGEAVHLKIAVTIPTEEKRSHGSILLRLSSEYEMEFRLPFLVTSTEAVAITRQVVQGKEVLTVNNQALQFQIASDLGGNLIRLQDGDNRTYLVDNFPEVKPLFFLPWHIGGLQPLIFTPNAEQTFTPPETITAKPTWDEQWEGVNVAWTMQHQPELRGLQFEIDSLVLPGSAIVRLRVTLHNPTPRRIEWVGGFFANIAFNESMEDIIIQAPGRSRVWQRNHVPKPFTSLTNVHQPWSAFTKGDQSLILAAMPQVKGKPVQGMIVSLDFNQVIGSLLLSASTIGPYEDSKLEFALAMNDDGEDPMTLIEALSV